MDVTEKGFNKGGKKESFSTIFTWVLDESTAHFELNGKKKQRKLHISNYLYAFRWTTLTTIQGCNALIVQNVTFNVMNWENS